MVSTALCAVATPDHYRQFALEMFDSAEQFFKPTEQVEFVLLDGEAGWPRATMCRHEILLQNLPDTDFVYLIDADMLFESEVGPEILPGSNTRITATQHPGYVDKPYPELPYEQNPESACFVPEGEGVVYYCGGFFGGTRKAMKRVLTESVLCMELDLQRQFCPSWHDESSLNRVLASYPPANTLDPSYCRPDRADFYIEQVWGGHDYSRKITALDKTAAERAGR